LNTLDRHIVATFIGNYVLLLLAGVGLYIFADFLFNLDEFTENRALTTIEILRNMADYYGNNLPLYFQQLGGVVMAIAASFTFAAMLKNNEMTALVAAGVPLQRLAVPVLLASVLLVALWAANSELVVPGQAHKIARKHDDLNDTRQVEVRCVRDDRNAILSAAELRSARGWMGQVSIIEPDDQGNPAHLIRADAAQWDEDARVWRLDRGARLTLGEAFTGADFGRTIRWEPVDEFAFTLSPEQILLRQSAEWADLMSIRQMNALLATRNLPNLPAVARSRDIRFTQPLLTWILMLLSIPFFLTREPANVLVAGGRALLLSGACFAFTFIAHSLASDPQVARFATALPVLVFGPLAVLTFANVRT
jgi:lipopolysaccharide export LptBFGC system permease protein LptF